MLLIVFYFIVFHDLMIIFSKVGLKFFSQHTMAVTFHSYYHSKSFGCNFSILLKSFDMMAKTIQSDIRPKSY